MITLRLDSLWRKKITSDLTKLQRKQRVEIYQGSLLAWWVVGSIIYALVSSFIYSLFIALMFTQCLLRAVCAVISRLGLLPSFTELAW